MAFTAEQLAALEEAASSGVLQAQIGDKIVRYQNLPDLLAAINLARADVARSAAGESATYRGTTRYYQHGRGY